MLALLLERVMELETKESFATLRTLFTRVRAVELILEGQSIWETSKLPPETKKLLSTLRLDAPPRVLPGAP